MRKLNANDASRELILSIYVYKLFAKYLKYLQFDKHSYFIHFLFFCFLKGLMANAIEFCFKFMGITSNVNGAFKLKEIDNLLQDSEMEGFRG